MLLNKTVLELYLNRCLINLFDKLTLRRESIKWRVFYFIILIKSNDAKTRSMKIQNKCEKSFRYINDLT